MQVYEYEFWNFPDFQCVWNSSREWTLALFRVKVVWLETGHACSEFRQPVSQTQWTCWVYMYYATTDIGSHEQKLTEVDILCLRPSWTICHESQGAAVGHRQNAPPPHSSLCRARSTLRPALLKQELEGGKLILSNSPSLLYPEGHPVSGESVEDQLSISVTCKIH